MRIVYKVMRNHNRQGIPCILLQIDNEKYFFNVPETTQRFVKDHGAKFARDSKFFFSRLAASHLAGIIGLSLTLYQNSLSQGCKIYGPPGITQFFRDLRYVTGIKMCHYSVTSMKPEGEEEILGLSDDELFLKLANSPEAIEIFSNWDAWCKKGLIPPKALNCASSLLQHSSILSKELNLKFGLHVYSDKVTEIMLIPISEKANAFVIIPKPIKGNFIPEKLKEFGIKGKQMQDLSHKGEIEVIYIHQVEIKGVKRIVKIDEVTSEASPSPLIVLLECPEDFNSELLESNDVLNYLLFNSMENENLDKSYYVSDIVHFADFNTVSKPNYQTWVNSI